MILRLLLVTWTVFAATDAVGHPLAPAWVVMEEAEEGTAELSIETANPGQTYLRPAIVDGCTLGKESMWLCDSDSARRALTIEGLQDSPHLVIVQYKKAGKLVQQELLSSTNTMFVVDSTVGNDISLTTFLRQGFGHMLAGIDHVLIVVALVFLLGFTKSAFLALLGFTIGHSVSLGLGSVWQVPQVGPYIEALIAVSLILMALEISGRIHSVTKRFPLLLPTLFGLVHGMGFAGGFAAAELDNWDFLFALASFNLGIELAQVAVILGLYVAHLAYEKLKLNLSGILQPATELLVGTTGFVLLLSNL